jgi:enterochelin esterase-like enzyme
MSSKPVLTRALFSLLLPPRTGIPPETSKSGSASTWLVLAALLSLLACQGAVSSCEASRKEPWETAPLKPGQVEVTRWGDQSNLSIERVRFFSTEMNEPRFFLALVPKTQSPPSEVFILNHGWWDRPEFLLTYLKVDRVYGELLAQGKVRPAIVVMPDVRFANFFREHSDRYPFPNYLTLVAEEVAGTVSRQYHIPFGRDHWSIGGFSFGGYLSLDVTRRYPGRFGSVSVVSGLTDDEWTYWPSTPPPPGRLDAKGRSKQTVVDPGPIPRIFLACGTDDRLFGTMQALHDRLTRLGIPHEWSTGPGGHTWKYWSSVLRPMFDFHLASDNGQERRAPR